MPDRSRTDDAAPQLWPAFLTVGALGSLPYLSLLAANVGEPLELDRVLTWWAVTLAVGVGAVLLARPAGVATARWVGGAVGVALLVFFNFRVTESIPAPSDDARWAWVAAGSVLVLGAIVMRRRVVQNYLAVVAPALLLAPLFQLVTAAPSGADATEPPPAVDEEALVHEPNVYWFVLDGFAGPPYLERELGVDTSVFSDGLEQRGFSVIEESRSNYPLTFLAVASALEMEYVYDGVDEPSPGPYFDALQGDSRTVNTFRANGYSYVHAYPGLWTGSRCSGLEDVCLGEHGGLSDTQWALAYPTPLLDVFVDEEAQGSVARANDPAHVIGNVLAAPPPEPYFAFIHLLNPHPPYLRDADCGLRDVSLDVAAWGDGPEYAAAVTCLMDRLSDAVDRILEADDDPVIVISGDHGPRLGLDASTTGERLLGGEMFLSAFNAIRLPAACDGLEIADDVTLVNTFRIVFGCLRDEEPDLLPDRVHPIRRDY